MSILSDPISRWTSLGRPLQKLSRGGAIAALAVLLLVMAWSAFATGAGPGADDARVSIESVEAPGDLQLHRDILERVIAGGDYYVVAADEQRQDNSPAKPFVTVPLPTLTWISAQFSETLLVIAAYVLMIITIIAWISALAPSTSLLERAAAGFLLFFAGISQLGEAATLLPELPAGLLLTLALGIYRPQRWWPSLVVAALALAISELALPFILLWAVFALLQSRRTEAGAVLAVIVVFLVAFYFHAAAISAQQLPTDPQSQGLGGMQGPQFVLSAISRLTPLAQFSGMVAGPIILLALLGWIGLGGRLGLFATCYFIGFGLVMALFARTGSDYWVMMILPACAAGLALAPRAIGDLVRNAAAVQKQRHS